MQTILNSITFAFIYASCFGVGLLLGKFIHDEISCRKTRNNVLKAIKDLHLEDELARCPALDVKLYIAIKTYLRDHGWRDPFIGPGSALDMTIVIADLRKKGKIKPLEPVEKSDEPVTENPIKLSTNAFSESTFLKWLVKWGFKNNLNMFQLMQYKLDEYKGDYCRLLKDMVYSRPVANEYLVTVHGEYVFVNQNTLADMEADFESTNTIHELHLFAIPKDWVDETVRKHPELILADNQCDETSSKTIKLSIDFGSWLEQFLERLGITQDCDQPGMLKEYYERHELCGGVKTIMLDFLHCPFTAEKYQVFARGKTGILTGEQLRKANEEIFDAGYSLGDNPSVIVHDNLAVDAAQPWRFALLGYPLE